MNSLVKELIKNFLPEEEKKQTTALYAGGFKPPTAGHFEVVKEALKQNPEIDEFIIFAGSKERDGVSQEESLLIWEIYNKYLPFKVKIEPSSLPPIKAVYDFAKEHPTREVLWILGAREENEQDFIDISSRTKSITNYPNIEARTIITKGGVSGTAARNASKVSFEKFEPFVPSVLTPEEKQEVYQIVSGKIQENVQSLKYSTPKFEEEWKEARRYPEFKRLGKNKWIELAKTGKPITITSAKDINNTDAADPESFKTLNPEKQERALAQLEAGNVEMPIVALYSDGYKELLAGNTRLTAMMGKNGEATVWQFNVPDEINENIYTLDIPKFNYEKTLTENLWDTLNEITLSKDNAVKINGNLTGGDFKVGNITYIYAINSIINPYKDGGKFYNISFYPEDNISEKPLGSKENYIKILSTMFKIISDFIEKIKPEYIGIASMDNDGSKNYHKVYANLTDNRFNNLPGYFRKDVSLEFNTFGGKGRFVVLKRKQDLKENALYSQHIDVKQKIKALTKHMMDKGMNIVPLPKVIFKHGDEENAKQFLGKTAYYNPEAMEIVLYTEGRHPKDIVRSFSHEMIHHIQNLEGRLGNVATTNTLEDDHLDKLEQEANLNGTMTFRNWTDSLNEEVVGGRIVCDNCGWSWRIEEGGDDLYICHKCGHDNTPLQEKKSKDPFGLNAYAMELARLREEETEYTIYCDMDSVLVDFDLGYQELTGMTTQQADANGVEAFWKPLTKAGAKFWITLQWMPDGKQLWDYIKKYNPILLSAPSREESSKLGKRVWVKRELPGVKLILKYASQKQEYASPTSILIDDRQKNIDQWEAAGGIGIFHTSTSNTIEQLKQLGL
jgi:hypothetical protein